MYSRRVLCLSAFLGVIAGMSVAVLGQVEPPAKGVLLSGGTLPEDQQLVLDKTGMFRAPETSAGKTGGGWSWTLFPDESARTDKPRDVEPVTDAAAAPSVEIFNAWWTTQTDVEPSNGCYEGLATLCWDPDVVGGGNWNVREDVYYRSSGSGPWTFFSSTAPHVIIDRRTDDIQCMVISMGPGGCANLDYRIDIFTFFASVPDDTRDPSNDADLSNHPEEERVFAEILPGFVWWTFETDSEPNGCIEGTARLNWDPVVSDGLSSLTVSEHVSRRPTGSGDPWTLLGIVAPHPIVGFATSDQQSVDITMGPGVCATDFDYLIEVFWFFNPFFGPDFVADPTTHTALSAHHEETQDTTPPVVAIDSPLPFGCICDPTTIFGTADDPDGAILIYVLEISPDTGGPWTTVIVGATPVSSGPLGVWSGTPSPEGYYFLRLTAVNAANLSSSVTTLVWVEKTFDTLNIRFPAAGAIVGDVTPVDGTVYDNNCFVSYRVDVSGGGPFTPVDPSSPVYTAWVYTDPFATWSTKTGPAAVSDGNYTLRVSGTNACGTAFVDRNVVVDNSKPTAEITSPSSCTYVNGIVNVFGTAHDAHLGTWVLQYAGGSAHEWVTIASGGATDSIVGGRLGTWDTRTLPSCAYTLRLVVRDRSILNFDSDEHNEKEYTVSLNVGSRFDVNGDGRVDLLDYAAFLGAFTGP